MENSDLCAELYRYVRALLKYILCGYSRVRAYISSSSNETAVRVSRDCVRGSPHETKGFTGVWSHYPARAIRWTKGL